MPFSFAIFSADWPIDSPVEGSAMAGVTGTKSRGRTRASTPRRSAMAFALLASTSSWLIRFECSTGMSESDSTPPASTTSACPRRIWSAALVMACAEEAQARLSVYAGTLRGNCGRRLTSRATLGVSTEGTTCPMTTSSMAAGSISVR